ncbi:hypothetical protein BDW60DRAFT_226324 [Aspergillus nidulans var. acristatus]
MTSLNILVVGAGLSGLATAISCAQSGHTVTVLEQAVELAEVGAGLQVTPNASRLFNHWGLRQSLWREAPEPKTLTVHRYTGDVLAHDAFFDKHIRQRYGAPFVDVHRVDLQQALYARAKELGIVVVLAERVKSILDARDAETSTATVLTESGNTYTADLVVAADGLWSRCRECLVNRKDEPLPTGDLAYRIVLHIDQISDPKLRAFVQNPQVHFWIGPGAHVVSYSMRGGNMINIVLLVPDNLPPGVSREAGSVEEMRGLFKGWDPVGDACHPMLPYLAQGANSSLEDGAVLGGLLGHLRHKSQLPQILKLYESLRKNRGEAIVRETFKQRHDFHLPDGEQQEKRDAIFKSQLGKEEIDPDTAFPSRWTCPKVQPWLYGYDAVREVENAVKANPDIFGDSGYEKGVRVEGQKLRFWAGLSSYLPLYLPILLFGMGKFVF